MKGGMSSPRGYILPDWPNDAFFCSPTQATIVCCHQMSCLLQKKVLLLDIFQHHVIYPIGSMYAIYGNIYHQYTPFMLAYIPYMDPMGI